MAAAPFHAIQCSVDIQLAVPDYQAEGEGESGGEGDAPAAEEVKRLPKPSVAAWTINQLSRQRKDAVGALVAAAAKLRKAQERALQSEGDAGNAAGPTTTSASR